MKIENQLFVAEDFRLKEKIPSSVLEEVVNYFAEDLELESIVQIRYEDGEYVVLKPEYYCASKVKIDYNFPIVESEYICMIHSHNTMKAFFSSVDDADELLVPGLYGVIGSIKEEDGEISFDSAFRYSFGNGLTKKLAIEQVFGD